MGDEEDVHDEPMCLDPGNGCGYFEPHHHGFACDATCRECFGHCHPACPAYGDEEEEW